MRKHRLDRRQRKHRKKMIIFSVAAIVCFFSVGYAAFSSNFLVSGKGTIIEKSIAIDELKDKKVTEGDGLYKDLYEEEKYIYRGEKPNNYINFNNELWRIMSIEEDNTLKIIRNESIGNLYWDAPNTRDSSTSTYCTNANSYGCNAWAATTNLVGLPSSFTLHYPNGNPNIDVENYTGTVTKDASLNTYLNTEFLSTINDDSRYIVNHDFNVGTPGNNSDAEDMETNINEEALYKWNGKVGLMSITEIIRTTTNKSCTDLNSGYGSNSIGVCNINNWMWPKINFAWTISPFVYSNCYNVWFVYSEGYIFNDRVGNKYDGVFPVVYLKTDISLKGKGSEKYPYTIVS